ncbi:MAG: hypothetical protein HFJ26_08500 [Clostridia bacterium]|nr:hypothetical protein [Clostridia bacterium]
MKTNDVIDGISIKIDEMFGDEYKIYTNNVKQGLEMPCFFIKSLPSNKQKLIGNRYENEINLVIHTMIEDSENKEEQLNDIADKLYELEYVMLLTGDLLRGYDMKTEISDGVLLFFITYKYFTYKQTQQEIEMNNLTINGEVKNE